jgi:hypothetical protein
MTDEARTMRLTVIGGHSACATAATEALVTMFWRG